MQGKIYRSVVSPGSVFGAAPRYSGRTFELVAWAGTLFFSNLIVEIHPPLFSPGGKLGGRQPSPRLYCSGEGTFGTQQASTVSRRDSLSVSSPMNSTTGGFSGSLSGPNYPKHPSDQIFGLYCWSLGLYSPFSDRFYLGIWGGLGTDLEDCNRLLTDPSSTEPGSSRPSSCWALNRSVGTEAKVISDSPIGFFCRWAWLPADSRHFFPSFLP